ncbi:GNAT family N-acetyltransferase [Leeia oryzae]|uniref:GNAT family N-acetyltransferase n=1 Tax=Leeia oryzae TaxID=356662 RepID=UPI000364E6D6|nr:N-acetyltransferase [Leeia oryzae]
MSVRQASRQDIPAIAQLHARSWRHAYRGALSEAYLAGDLEQHRQQVWQARLQVADPTSLCLLAEANGQLQGFSYVQADRHPHWGSLLDNLHVDPDLHRTGIGKQLLLHTARWCMDNATHPGLHLWVLQSNAQALAFYQALGAQAVSDDVWSPPGGGAIPRFCYAWADVNHLADMPARHP